MKVSDIIRAGGGVAAMARALGLHHTTIIGWRRRGQIPAERCQDVHHLTGIAKRDIRPDIYLSDTKQERK